MTRNLPNLITIARLVLAVILVVLLGTVDHFRDLIEAGVLTKQDNAAQERLLLNVSVVILGLAAFSDWLDGQIARRWELQTDFGRIVDPFADKVTVCGTFVMLVPLSGSQVSAWMVVVILARELLVDGLRGFAESRGVKFPSMYAGKVKMFVQSICLGWILLTLANWQGLAWAEWTAFALIYATIAITLYSGAGYLFHARKVLSADSINAPVGATSGAA